MKTLIHVNQHIIRSNKKTGAKEPVITCKNYQGNFKANSVNILGNKGEVVATIKYDPVNPLPCGATCWIETENKIEVLRSYFEEDHTVQN